MTRTQPTHRQITPATHDLTSTTQHTHPTTHPSLPSTLFKIHYSYTHLCITIRWAAEGGNDTRHQLILKPCGVDLGEVA